MKITINIDCSPAEARAFLGLPDVAPLQDAVMKEAEQRMMAALKSMDAEAMFKAWLPGGLGSIEKMQRAFWEGLAGKKTSE
ncbi:MAG TPA: DUF6489 family protein [Hypericibacter adhaerens]|jgi:hypothetical protein|uniref:Ribosomal protein S1 n=1 Tax=Hypericibacter adhaerens TaxID=2602016 RepID=A0A5J6N5D5_9PROT|nr:DUF6489 family protein [Hypericibacter adhaerens]QEX25109.1 hypothetical protein FRZ61_50550 [Hypericibacter adhaerens]HWA45710.1 DUF6489 family protein [Hypericibacter adhaerens]